MADNDDAESAQIRRCRIAGEPSLSVSTSVRKPRGRPPGSKNKPKPPVIITRESDSAMHPVILHLPAGADILQSVANFARRRKVGVSVIGTTGAVSTLALRQPATSSSSFTLSGRFDILSLSGTVPPPGAAAPSPEFSIAVAGARGEVIGGAVTGPVTAAGNVVVVGAFFLSADVERLPEAEVEAGGVPGVTGGEEFGLVGPGKLTGQLSRDMALWGATQLRSGQY